MTMNFIIIKDALKAIFAPQDGVEYRLIGYQRQEKAAETLRNKNREVVVYFRRFTQPKGRSRFSGPATIEAEYSVELQVSAATNVNLLDLETNDPAKIQTALAGLKEASDIADTSMDELIDIVWNVLNDARNKQLGLDDGIMSSAWTSEVTKGEPNPRGGLVVLSASIPFTCTTTEEPSGEVPVDIVENNIDNIINEDTNQKTGTKNTY